MSTRVRTACEACGWGGLVTGYRSQAQADYARRRHSCDKERRTRSAYERGQARNAAVDRTPRPCHHTQAEHVHGTHACYVHDRCRCLPCSVANATYETTRTRDVAYGRPRMADAGPAREHVAALRAAGLGMHRIAAAAGVSPGALRKLVSGSLRPDGTKRNPSRRVTPSTASRILAVPMPDVAELGATVLVDSAGTRRRLEALGTLGWAARRLVQRAGVGHAALLGAMAGRPVAARTALAVRDLYEALWDQAPPQTTRGERVSVARTRRRAAALSWAPPLAWDDDSIDDPAAQPAHAVQAPHPGIDHAALELALTGTTVTLTRAERWVAVERLAGLGLSDSVIAARLSTTDRTVLRDRQLLGIPSTWKAAS